MKPWAVICTAFLLAGCTGANEKKSQPDDESLLILQKTVYSQGFWVKVHAIEFLADLGYQKDALRYTNEELASFDSIPEKRIGFWRCKYKLSDQENDKTQWFEKIKNAYLDRNGPDRIHAVETLAKLGFSLKNVDAELVEKDLKSQTALGHFTLWGNILPAKSGGSPDFERLFAVFDEENAEAKKIAAYSLGFMASMPEQNWNILAQKALAEPEQSVAYPYMLGAAYMAYHSQWDENLFLKVRQKLTALQHVQDKAARIALCRALAVNGDDSDLPLLKELMHLSDPIRGGIDGILDRDIELWNEDVRAAAAYALLSLEKKK
jgi:hypothetical protein